MSDTPAPTAKSIEKPDSRPVREIRELFAFLLRCSRNAAEVETPLAAYLAAESPDRQRELQSWRTASEETRAYWRAAAQGMLDLVQASGIDVDVSKKGRLQLADTIDEILTVPAYQAYTLPPS